jgi:hypothetical protein
MKKRTGLRMALLTVAVTAALALPAQAIASDNCSTSDPTASQYCPPTKVTGSGSASGTAAVTGTSDPGSLPFTGLDAISLLAIAAALTGAGLVLRRLSAGGGERSS